MWTIDQDEFLYVYGENYVIRGLGDDEVKSALGEKIFWEKNGSEMMLIPDGSFGVGDHHDNYEKLLTRTRCDTGRFLYGCDGGSQRTMPAVFLSNKQAIENRVTGLIIDTNQPNQPVMTDMKNSIGLPVRKHMDLPTRK